jgi:hypothetical protein
MSVARRRAAAAADLVVERHLRGLPCAGLEPHLDRVLARVSRGGRLRQDGDNRVLSAGELQRSRDDVRTGSAASDDDKGARLSGREGRQAQGGKQRDEASQHASNLTPGRPASCRGRPCRDQVSSSN